MRIYNREGYWRLQELVLFMVQLLGFERFGVRLTASTV